MTVHLEYLQLVFAVLGFAAVLALLCGRFFIVNKQKVYENSRWLLMAMMLDLGIHYTLQLVFGFRAMGDDVGALVNIPFYATATLFLTLSMLNLLQGGKICKWYIVGGIVFTSLIWVLAVGAVVVTGEWHQPQWFIGILMAIYFVCMVASYLLQIRYFRRAQRSIDEDLGNPNDIFLHHLRFGAYIIYGGTLVLPTLLLTHVIMAILGLIMMPVLFLFCVSFVGIGNNVYGVLELLEDTEVSEGAEEGANIEGVCAQEECHTSVVDNATLDTDDTIRHIEGVIASWREAGGYANNNVSLSSFAKDVGIPQRQLSAYFGQHLGCTFRSWITRVRVEEAMKKMTYNPNYSCEAIADDCGFSSRSFFQTAFKNVVGMPPKEWLDKHKG